MSSWRFMPEMTRSLRRCAMVLGLALAMVVPLSAQTLHTTPGTIARFGLPTGFQFQYDQNADTLVLLEPQRRQLVVFVWAPGETSAAVAALLTELGGDAYTSQIRAAAIAGLSGSEVRIDAGGAKDRILALSFDGMLLGFWGKTAGDHSDLDEPIATIIRSLSLAESSYPAVVSGTYQTRSMASTDWDGGGLFGEEYVTLHPNGAAERSDNIGGQVGDVSLSSSGVTTGIQWEVRGNRLLFYADGDFLNYGFEAFNNGLELSDQDGTRYLWVRQ